MVELGLRPNAVDVLLPFDADFVASIDADDDEPWPDGVVIALVFSSSPRRITPDGLRWEAVIDGPTASWAVDKVDVAAVLAAGVTHARLLYVEGDTELLWAKGAVRAV